MGRFYTEPIGATEPQKSSISPLKCEMTGILNGHPKKNFAFHLNPEGQFQITGLHNETDCVDSTLSLYCGCISNYSGLHNERDMSTAPLLWLHFKFNTGVHTCFRELPFGAGPEKHLIVNREVPKGCRCFQYHCLHHKELKNTQLRLL